MNPFDSAQTPSQYGDLYGGCISQVGRTGACNPESRIYISASVNGLIDDGSFLK